MEDEFYILATDSSAEESKRVLKDGETFAVFDLHGDIQPDGPCQEGLYHEGTRFLSHLLLKLGHTRPFLLNSNVQKDNLLFIANLTNPDIYQAKNSFYRAAHCTSRARRCSGKASVTKR